MRNSVRPLLKGPIYKTPWEKPDLAVHSSYTRLLTRLQTINSTALVQENFAHMTDDSKLIVLCNFNYADKVNN